MKWEDESDEAEEEGMEHVERGYRGIHLTFPLKRTDLELLIDTFRKRKVLRYQIYLFMQQQAFHKIIPVVAVVVAKKY